MQSDHIPYAPVIRQQLEGYFASADWNGMTAYLDRLSHKDFRIAGQIIGTVCLPEADEDAFWSVFYHLLEYNARAFLGTILKSVPERIRKGSFTLRHPGFIVLSNRLMTKNAETDIRKLVSGLLGLLDNPDDISYLFQRFGVVTSRSKLDYLLRTDTLAACYMLFLTLRELEHDRDLIVKSARYLLKANGSYAFNMVSFLKAYFDLEEIKGTFSLRLKPYELGPLEASYPAFAKLIQKM